MQSVNTSSTVQQTYREADCVQSNIPGHCACPFPSFIQGALQFRVRAADAYWWVTAALSSEHCLECLKYQSWMNLRHFTEPCTHQESRHAAHLGIVIFSLLFYGWVGWGLKGKGEEMLITIHYLTLNLSLPCIWFSVLRCGPFSSPTFNI